MLQQKIETQQKETEKIFQIWKESDKSQRNQIKFKEELNLSLVKQCTYQELLDKILRQYDLQINKVLVIKEANSFFLQEPMYKAVMGKYNPPFKESPKYTLHEENNLNQAVLLERNILYQPASSSNFNSKF